MPISCFVSLEVVHLDIFILEDAARPKRSSNKIQAIVIPITCGDAEIIGLLLSIVLKGIEVSLVIIDMINKRVFHVFSQAGLAQ
jgi:hypothetical protein